MIANTVSGCFSRELPQSPAAGWRQGRKSEVPRPHHTLETTYVRSLYRH